MILTQQTPRILLSMMLIYKKQCKDGKAYRTYKSLVCHNNEPVNILKVMYVLKDVQTAIELDWGHPVEFEYCLRYCSEISGYSPVELANRLEY